MSLGPLAEASAGTLRALATALRNGQLGPTITRMALGRVAQCPESLGAELCRLSAEGLAPAHMSLLLEIAADAAEQRLSSSVPASLVWTGPESAVSHSRDTAVVVDELFVHAGLRSCRSYVVQKGTIVFRSLAERMVAAGPARAVVSPHRPRMAGYPRRIRIAPRVRSTVVSPMAWPASARSLL